MKKILFIFSLICAFTINANAQDRKLTPQELAKNDVVEMTQVLKLSDTDATNFKALLEMKYQLLQDSSLSEERKSVLRQSIEAKIRATLSSDKMTVLEKNKELFKRLIN